MRKRVLYSCVLAVALTMSITGCKKKETEIKTIEYSEQIGTAEGTVDFESEEAPEIDIKEIRAYKGENIDYSSGIDIKNVDKFEDFQMWVDSTGVDIYVPGKYIAVYRFVYNGKTVEENVSVTILEKEEEQQASTYSSANNLASNNGSQGNSTQGNAGSQGSGLSDTAEATTPQGNGGNTGGNSTGAVQNPAGNNSQGAGSQPPTVSQPEVQPPVPQQPTVQPLAPQQPPAGQSGSQPPVTQQPATQQPTTARQPETSREIVTTKKTSTDKISTIGYTNIELLSGTYVKIKCTNAKYIVSTRTDTSTTVKNGVNYEVAKLIITYNTGAEQILETVETVIK